MKKPKKKTKPAKSRKKQVLRDALGRFKKPPLRDKQGRFKSPKRKRPSPPKPVKKRKRPSPPKPVKKRKRPSPPKPVKKRKRPSPPKPVKKRKRPSPPKPVKKRKRPSPPKPVKKRKLPPKPVKKRNRPILWIEHFVEDEKIQYAWTWKILALVPPTYNGRKDAHEDDVEGDDNRILQYMHTKFVTSKRAARLELSRFVNEMTDKYDDIEFKEFTLYQVGGYGPITTKDWIEHESYNNYDGIPKR